MRRYGRWLSTDISQIRKEYEKFFWFNPKKFKIEKFLQPLIMTLEENEGYNDYVYMLLEEKDYKENAISDREMNDGYPFS